MDIAKLAGVDALKLVVMIVQAAQTVRHNKKTCQQLVHHVQIIGDLLKKLQTPEMMEHPETRNGLNDLEEILREAYVLVTSCQNNNYVYHLFTGKKQADQFRILQNRMNSCLQVFPLISHIDTTGRLDKILEIIRPPRSQAIRDVPRLLTGCSSCDTRTEVYSELKRCSLQVNCAEALKFSLPQLVAATDNFSDRNLIGKGSFCCVYKGELHDGLEIAVKRCFDLSSSSNLLDVQDYQFQNEICFLPKLQHTNIIKLLGDCMQERERILVYEYMSNGSLDSFICGARTRRFHLDWPTHFQIIKGIAEGLLYLHKLSGLHIIHGDLKPSNILLDTNMKPKISDFGLSRTYNPGADEEFADRRRIVGSIGFTAPECRERHIFSIKSDVYGFGALLLEIISGNRCFALVSGESGYDHGFLNKRAWQLWRAGRLIKFVDSPPGDESERMEILRCIKIALLCVEENPANRPTMQEVVLMLSCHIFVLPAPQHPAYLA